MDGAKAVKRHNAQYDIFNRLHSIESDQAFVQKVAKEWFESRFEVVPNQRCGTWYCPPSGTYAYFKSTDGHTNNWNFNLRRANVALAKYAEESDGLILVDSTRRGKRMPDALSKTIPIWCAVINRAILQRNGPSIDGKDAGAWMDLYLPPSVVSSSEGQQILDLIPTWAESLLSSGINLPALSKPLRPFFIHPSTSQPPHIPSNPEYTPIVCLSASRCMGITGLQDDVPSVTRVGSRNVGFEYVPGAGDDDELWAKGLTPAVFWRERQTLLSLDREALEQGLEGAKNQPLDTNIKMGALSLGDTSPRGQLQSNTGSTQLVGAPRPTSRLGLDIGLPTSPVETWSGGPSSKRISVYLVGVPKAQAYPETIYTHPTNPLHLAVALPSPKIDSWAYKDALAKLVSTVRLRIDTSTRILLRPGSTHHLEQMISTNKDNAESLVKRLEASTLPEDMVSSRKMVIPIALLLLCAFSLDGQLDDDEELTKSGISNILLSLVGLWPDSNPPRAALKRVNEVLLSREK